MITRRDIFVGLAASLAAPATVKASSLTPAVPEGLYGRSQLLLDLEYYRMIDRINYRIIHGNPNPDLTAFRGVRPMSPRQAAYAFDFKRYTKAAA